MQDKNRTMIRVNLSRTKYCLIAIVLIFLQACNDCHLVDCQVPGASTRIVFLQDDVDVLFADNPIVLAEDVKIISEKRGDYPYNPNDQELIFFLDSNDEYQFILGSLDTITIKGKTQVSAQGECCAQYEFTEILVDGNVICQVDCSTLEINL